MNIILMGLPGAGKGTQGKRLSQKLKMHHLSSGKIIRKVARQNSSIGTVVKRYINRGELVPNEIITRIMKNRIMKLKRENKILDGFPRNKKQIHVLEEILSNIEEKINLVIYLKVDEEELITRLTGRRVCRLDNTVYHIKYDPPQKKGKCDKCGANIYQRKDDKREVVKKKIMVNRKKLDIIKKHYQNKGLLEVIDGNKDPAKVEQEIENIIELKKI